MTHAKLISSYTTIDFLVRRRMVEGFPTKVPTNLKNIRKPRETFKRHQILTPERFECFTQGCRELEKPRKGRGLEEFTRESDTFTKTNLEIIQTKKK